MMYIGIDIGGTKCAVSVGDMENGRPAVRERRVLPTADFPNPAAMLPALAAEIDAIAPREAVRGIGISCGGPLDSEKGLILSPPNLPGWDRVEIVKYFESRYRVPVALENDANACALAEWQYGAGTGSRDFVFFTFGTGNGAGLILNGELHRGAACMAGEAGHWRMAAHGPVGYGKPGSLEGFCSGGGIAQLARREALARVQMGRPHPFSDPESVTARDVFALAEKKDPLCSDIVHTVGTVFGRALALLVDLLNPEIIVAGGIFTRNYHMLHPIAWNVVREECLAPCTDSCRLLPSALGESIGDIAALSVAVGQCDK